MKNKKNNEEKVKTKLKEKIKLKEKVLKPIKEMTFKSYLKDTFSFIKTKLLKIVIIELIITTLTFVFILQVPQVFEGELPNVTFLKHIGASIPTIIVVVLSGLFPYLYAPALGIISVILNEGLVICNLILKMGYIKGIFTAILPFILNVFVMLFASAIGIYICRNMTIGSKISSIKTRGIESLRISIYESANKKNKVKAIREKRDAKIKKLESKRTDLDVFQIINVTVILMGVQIFASLAKAIII